MNKNQNTTDQILLSKSTDLKWMLEPKKSFNSDPDSELDQNLTLDGESNKKLANEQKINEIKNIKEMQEIKNKIEKKCTRYTFSYCDIFFPNIILFKQLCFSFDKTKLFLISFVRVLLYAMITKLIYEKEPFTEQSSMLLYLFAFMTTINIIYIIFVLFKFPIISSNNITNLKQLNQ
jgi:hypothetical protein